MTKPNSNPPTLVIAHYLGSSAFILVTPDAPLGLVTAYPKDSTGTAVPPEVWLLNRDYIRNELADHLASAAKAFLGRAPTELRMFFPEGGAA